MKADPRNYEFRHDNGLSPQVQDNIYLGIIIFFVIASILAVISEIYQNFN